MTKKLYNCDICHKEGDVIFHVVEGKIDETQYDLLLRSFDEKLIPTQYCENCLPEYAKEGCECERELLILKITKLKNNQKKK